MMRKLWCRDMASFMGMTIWKDYKGNGPSAWHRYLPAVMVSAFCLMLVVLMSFAPVQASENFINVNSTWSYVSADATDQTTGDVTINANTGYDAIAGSYTANVIVTLPEGITFSDNDTSTKIFSDVGLSESTPLYLFGDTDLLIDVGADVSGSITADVRVFVKYGVAYVLDVTESHVIAKVAASSVDASLSGLFPSNGSLDPAFDSSVYEYLLNVENSVSSITLTPIVNDSNAAVTVNGAAVVNGTASEPIDLVAGIPQAIPVVVTAQDGVTTQTYTVTATRAENVIPSGYVGVTCSYTWVDADVNQTAGEIYITEGDDYSSIVGEIDKVYVQITLPMGVLCSSYENSAGTKEISNGNEILISNPDPNIVLSNIVLDIDPAVSGAIITDVRVYGKNSSGEYVFDRTVSKTIAKVNGTVLSISAATARTVLADVGQRGADLTIRETSPNLFSDPNEVTITILTPGVTWDIDDFSISDNFTTTLCTVDNAVVDTDTELNFSIIDDPAQISRVIFIPRFDVSPAATGDIVVRVSGTNIETADYILAQVAVITDLTLSDDSIEMNTDGEMTIRAYLPSGVTTADIMGMEWETDDGDVAEIVDYDVSNPGYVTFTLNSYDVGSCTITISVSTTVGNFQSSCAVTVTDRVAGTGYVNVTSSWTWVDADANQTAGDIHINEGVDYSAIASEIDEVYVQITLPMGVLCSSYENSAGTKEISNGNEILISNTNPNVVLSNIVLDIDPAVSGAITTDVRVYGKSSSGEYVFDQTVSKTIAKIYSTVLSISAATAETVVADLDQRGADLTIRETSPNVFGDPNEVTITILTPGVTWDIAASGPENFAATFSTVDSVLVDTDKILHFNVIDDPAQISRVIFTPIFDVSPASTGDIVVRVSGSNILTTDFTVAEIAVPVTVTPESPNVNVDTTPLQITVPADVDNASLTTSPVDGVVIIPQVNVQSSTDQGYVDVSIAGGTEVTGPTDWDGTINLPQVVDTGSVTVIPENGYEASVSGAIEIGLPDTTLTFSQPVRIMLAGQGGKKAGWILNETFTPISYEMAADTAEALEANPDGYITVGSDLVIWTTHFTTFVAYTEIGLPGYTLSGQVLMEGDDLTEGQPHYSGGVNIELKQGEEIKYTTTSSEAQDLVSNGSFSLTGIAAGDYTVVISKAGYLTRSFALTINSDLTLTTTSNQYLNRIYLLAGDIVSDEYNVIAASDVNYILSKFNSNSTQPGFDPQVDIVKDQYNVISAADVNLMLSNFNKNSTQYPADIIY